MLSWIKSYLSNQSYQSTAFLLRRFIVLVASPKVQLLARYFFCLDLPINPNSQTNKPRVQPLLSPRGSLLTRLLPRQCTAERLRIQQDDYISCYDCLLFIKSSVNPAELCHSAAIHWVCNADSPNLRANQERWPFFLCCEVLEILWNTSFVMPWKMANLNIIVVNINDLIIQQTPKTALQHIPYFETPDYLCFPYSQILSSCGYCWPSRPVPPLINNYNNI